jgi:hypothetical protein
MTLIVLNTLINRSNTNSPHNPSKSNNSNNLKHLNNHNNLYLPSNPKYPNKS